MKKNFAIAAVLVTLMLPIAAVAQTRPPTPAQPAPPCDEALRVADRGFRYRVETGDFVREPGRPVWFHLLTEPVVTSVEPDGAASGRLMVGDVIVAVDDQLITTLEGSRRLALPVTGQSVALTVRRNGRTERTVISASVDCADAVVVPDAGRSPEGGGGSGAGRLGMALRCDECAYEPATRRWRFARPPTVTATDPGSPAATHLQVGDRLIAIDGISVTTPEGGLRLGSLTVGQRVELRLERNGERFTVTVTATAGTTK